MMLTASKAASCLADVLEDLGNAKVKITTSACADEGGARCARACAGGDAAACYARALKAQREQDDTSSARASHKFRKACELGLAIACTNYAAELWLSDEQDDIDCARRIFEKTCSANETWGCGMLDDMLIDRDGAGPAELARGRGILERACDELGASLAAYWRCSWRKVSSVRTSADGSAGF